MATGITEVRNDFKIKMEKMLSQAGSVPSAMSRIYPMYQKFQTQRFMTENSSQGTTWAPLSPVYAERKRKRFSGYPGAGGRLMIATGTLAGAVIGPGAPFQGTDHHRFITTSTGMTISVEQSGVNAAGKPFNYAEFAAEKRPIMTFNEDSIEQMKKELAKFILGL